MMTESQALETLTREDPEAAGDAKAALAWLTGDEGLETISLLRLQEFLWYALPVKWPMSTPGRVGVAKALGRLFMLAGLDRYAGVCSSAGTEKIITAYADGHEEGIAAYTEAIEESNAAPPDTELLAWGSVMGSQERAAYDACAAALELAFASGELSVGARGWRTKRADIVNRWLTGRTRGHAEPAGRHRPTTPVQAPRRRAGHRHLAGPHQRRAHRRVGARPPGRAVAAGPRAHSAPARAARPAR